MKTIAYFFCGFLLLSILPLCQAQQITQQVTRLPSPTTPAVVARDANSRVWERTEYQQGPNGQVIPIKRQYTELADGLCYQKNGKWMDSQEQINILPDGTACATNGPHQAYFPADIYNGVITLVTPDGLQLKSQPVGLSYDDGTNTVLIAELTNSVGQLIASNQVIYPNAFAGVNADLLYTYRKGGFEQDVVFRQQPPAPEEFGLSSASTRLQLLTEFFNTPNPRQTPGSLNRHDGLQDSTLAFGKMKMGHGRAFLNGSKSLQNLVHPDDVYKSWVEINGRTILIEELPYNNISLQLASLSRGPAISSSGSPILHKVSARRLLPPTRLAEVVTNTIQLAKADVRLKGGVVLDYFLVNSAETNFTFNGDTVYYVSANCVFSGTTTIEGSAVVKFGPSGFIEIDNNGSVDCKTGPYRPAIFTSQNDDSVGEPIWGISTGTPNFSDMQQLLEFDSTIVPVYLHDLHFSYGLVAAYQVNWPATNLTVRDCEFYNVIVPVYGYDVSLYNDLFGVSRDEMPGITNNEDAQVFVGGPSFVAENVTADSGYAFIEDDSGAVPALTNCLVTSEPMYSPWGAGSPAPLTNAVIYLPSPSSPVYQPAGGGNYYLANGSPCRGHGTANIDPDLYVELAEKTTYPPVVYQGTNLSSLGTLGPCVARDTNTFPDIGYHYDRIDYALGGCVLSSSLTFASGTAVAWFEAGGTTYVSGQPYGISLNSGANLSFNGNATQPCVFARSDLVQEGANWGNTGWNLGIVFMGSSQEATVSANFTEMTSSFFENILQDRASKGQGFFRNCEFYNNFVTTWSVQYLYYTNCLFFRPGIALWNSPNFTLENCTAYNGGITMDRSSAVNWFIENCSFDGTGFNGSDIYSGTSHTTIDHNAYNTNNFSWHTYPLNPSYNGKLAVSGSSDLLVTNYNWQTNWFGNFYLPWNSPLVTNGSTGANLVGLYHFTTQTNQIPNGTNKVDIGYHYVASDTNGVPLDSNGDGIPDYLEDPLGNGLPFNGTNWALTILVQPTNQAVFAGAYVTVNVTAGGVAPLAYQWYFNSNLIANATSSILLFPDIQTNKSGYYFAIVTNNFGAITSSIAKLTIVPLDALLDVDFGARSASAKSGYAAIGDSSSDSWNEYGQTNVPSGSLPNLLTAEGQISQVGLLVTNLPTGGLNGSSDPMYNDYLSAPIDQVATLTVTNLPTGTWDIYLYSDDSTFDLSAGTNYYGFQTCYDQPLSGLLWQPGGQYVVFDNVSVSNQEPVTINIYPGNNLAALISGLQIASSIHSPSGFSGSVTVDSDYDGVSDYYELVDRTDTNNPNSVLPIELGSWSFDTTTTWVGDQGQLPLLATNIVAVPSWSTNAVQVDTNKSAVLCYRDVETNGDANINLRCGSVRFWFRPDWNSADQGGTGPGSSGRLIEVGSYHTPFTNGWWSLYLSPAGTNLLFGTSTNGCGMTNFVANVSWVSNIWHQLVLTYTTNNSLFYFDGQLVTNGSGPIYYPNVTERGQGFRIGSDTNGANQARGAFDVLETFNYPLSASDISSNYQAATQQDSDGDGLPDTWEMDYFGHLGNDPNADPNGDGLDNAQDAAAGLNPLIPEQIRLGYWRFNNAPLWQDEQGLSPSVAQGLFPIPDWSGDAVEISSQSDSLLGYRGTRTNGVPVVTCPTGSISFWFKPDWNGATVTNWSGGPGVMGSLFEIGRETPDASYGWFAMTVDPLGTKINFASESGGVHTNIIQAPVQFNSHTWYQVVLTYNPQATALYVNGQLLASGNGLNYFPGAAVMQQGFYVGCNWDGSGQAGGRFDELETYNYALAATNIAANYAAAIGVLAVDGLPVIVKDGWNLRSDVFESVCDGLPDWWMLSMGFDPMNTNALASQLLQEYGSGVGSSLPQYQMVNAASNLINIDFTAGTAATESSIVHGPTVAGFSVGDQWNFCNMQSNYLYGGIPLNDSGGNPSGIYLHAYIGPCVNGFVDERAVVNNNAVARDTQGLPIIFFNPYNYSTYVSSTTNVNYLLYGANIYDPSYNYLALHCFADPEFYPPDYYQDYMTWGRAYYNGYWPYLITWDFSIEELLAEEDVPGLTLAVPGVFNFYYSDANDVFSQAQYFSLSGNDQGQLDFAFSSSTAYAQWLGNYIRSNNLATAGTFNVYNEANCFLPPFASATSVPLPSGDNPMLGDGLVWNFPKASNSVPILGFTNIVGSADPMLGDWFSAFYPTAKRNLLISGLPEGQYGVYVYYDCSEACAPATVNGVSSTAQTMADGKQYWYCRVASRPSFFPTTFAQCVGMFSSNIPPGILISNTDYIQVTVDSPVVLNNPGADVKMLGLQLVRLSSTASTLEVRAGQDAAYLIWQPTASAVSYNIFQAINTPNTWQEIASTNGLDFQVTNLTAGTTYYYMLQSVASGGGTSNSIPESVVPFDCPDPLPPRIDYVNTLELPANNDAYTLTMSNLLSNSDAYDPQAYPLVFKVAAVISGSLTINGAPFSQVNCTIDATASAVWTPPSGMNSTNLPALAVYVFDGINRSTNSVNVQIKQGFATHLFGWGLNYSGSMGNGYMYDLPNDPQIADDPLAFDETNDTILPWDPRWQYYSNGDVDVFEPSPIEVLDSDNITSLSTSINQWLGHVSAISKDGHLWQWGYAEDITFGKVITGGPDASGGGPFWEWGQPIPSSGLSSAFALYVLSPIEYQMPTPGGSLPFSNIKKVIDANDVQIVLKNDGTLWSWGPVSDLLGRNPDPQDDFLEVWGGAEFGVSPRQIAIPGNDASGLLPGRNVVEITEIIPGSGSASPVIARCQDGTLWWWGDFDEFQPDNINIGVGVPTRLTCFDSPSGEPDPTIVQIAVDIDHVIALKSDGSVWEVGYDFGQNQTVPSKVAGLPVNICQIALCTDYFDAEFPVSLYAALTADGNVWVWGNSPDLTTDGNLLTVGTLVDSTNIPPQQIVSLKDIKKVVVQTQSLLALDNAGRVWGWGTSEPADPNPIYTGSLFGPAYPGSFFDPASGGGLFIYTNAIPIAGLENVSDIFLGESDAFAIGTAVKNKPVGLSAAPMDQSVELNWTNYPGASYYVVYRSLNPNAGYVAIGRTADLSFLDGNPPLQNGQIYYYEVSSVVNGIETERSWDVSATPEPIPSPVQNFTLTEECRDVVLTWNLPANTALSNPQEYRVLRADSSTSPFIIIAYCPAGATAYEDNTIVPGKTCFYQVVPVNSAGEGNSTTVSGAINPGTCALPPVISAKWQQYSWFTVSGPPSGDPQGNGTATLDWTGSSWGSGVSFCIQYFYKYPDGQYSEMFSTNIPMSQTSQQSLQLDAGDWVQCYGYSWPVPPNIQCWACVSAIVDGQQGASSIEVGPLASINNNSPWQITPNAVPGYHQVYLDWPGDVSIYSYGVDCTALVPSWSHDWNGRFIDSPNAGTDPDWVTLTNNVFDLRYWHTSLTPTNFTPVDFKYVGDLVGRITNASDAVSSIIWGDLSSSAQAALIGFQTNEDTMTARTNLAIDLTALIQRGSLIFDTNQVGMEVADISTGTKTLLNQWNNGDTNPVDVATLNRLLLEDAYVHDVARYETPSPAEFVSGDFNNAGDILGKFQSYALYQNTSDPVADLMWNSLSQGATNTIINNGFSAGSDGGLAMQRLLAAEFTRIIQTNMALFTVSQVLQVNYDSGVSDRTLDLMDNIGQLTNNYALANRLLLQDAWGRNDIEPLSDLRYYWVNANFCNGSYAASDWVGARPNDQAPVPPSLNFWAQAVPMNGLVSVQWNVPGTAITNSGGDGSAWQFSVSRNGNDGSPYSTILETTFGLSYLDSDVTNDLSYQYQVTAFDTNYDRYIAVTGPATPTNSSGLTLLPPQAGNEYVDLTWTPLQAATYAIVRSTSPNGSFTGIGTVDLQYASRGQGNTFEDDNVQDGTTYYYQIQAITPAGYKVNSEIQSATPSATLAPLPPNNFHGQFIPDNANGRIIFNWDPRNGAQNYQLFLADQSRLTPLPGYNGVDTSYAYELPLGIDQIGAFTFALRSVSSMGVAGDLTETIVTNQPLNAPPTLSSAPVVLQVGGSLSDLTVIGPTNLALVANVNVPDVQEVDFYSDSGNGLGPQLIGTANSAPFQMTWFQVPAGTNTITAVAVAADQGVFGPVGSSYSSGPVVATVNIQPLLSAFQTSATDLQLPAPGLPIAISRSYSSRITNTNAPLGVGWTANWTVGSVTLTADLDQGWSGLRQSGLAASYYYVGQASAHSITVTLPNGQSFPFAPNLQYTIETASEAYDPADGTPDFSMQFQPLIVNEGSLNNASGGSVSMEPQNGDFSSSHWDGRPITIGFSPSTWTYTGPDGTQYQFGLPAGNSTWLLTKITDLNGNSLNYSYDANHNLFSISHSCGRAANFVYVQTATGMNIEVFDAIGGGNPSVIYVISNNQLVQVRQLQDRVNGIYLTNSYAYGQNATDTNNFNRITQVFDARGIQVLQNLYTNGDGDVAVQTSPGKTNFFAVDPVFYNVLVTSASSTATNTVEEKSDQTGAPVATTLPASGTQPSTTLAVQNSFNNNGLLNAQADANGNTKTYSYDGLNRLIGQSDQNGNSTSQELDPFGKPTISTDANGNQTLYKYDNAENPSSTMDPSETITSYTYSPPLLDSQNNVIVGELETSESQDAPYVPYTIVTTNIYDVNPGDPIKGDLLQTSQEWVDKNGNVVGTPVTTSYTYDANGNRQTETKTRSVNSGTQAITTTYTYDAQNRVIQTVISATGSETLSAQTSTVTYNELGKQAKSTDAAGRTTTNVYDFNGNLIETEYPDGTVSRTFYNGFSQAVYSQDRTTNYNGTTTAPATYNIYDASGRVIRSGRSDGVQLTKQAAVAGTDFSGTPNETEYKLVVASAGTILTTNLTFYDAVGNVQYSVSDRGAVTQNQYDPAGHLTNSLVYTAYTFTQGVGNTPSPTGPYQNTSYTYDPNGNQVTVTDAKGNTTTSVYDEANQLVEEDEPAAGGSASSRYTFYDGLGRKIGSIDEAGIATSYTYDFRGLLTSVTLGMDTPQSATTIYQYDEAGNEIAQSDAAGRTTTFHYDALGRRTGRTLPGSQSEGFAYDLAGNQVYHTNFNGVIITNQYDIDGRLTNCGSVGYHAAYAYGATGLRTNMVDAGGTTTFFYNDLNELTNKTEAWNNGPTISLNYKYDITGSVTNIYSSTANGVNLAYNYDILGRITNVLANGSPIANYGYDIVGNLQAMQYGNGVTNLYQYDAMNRLTNLVWNLRNSPLAGFAYNLGPAGNRLSLVETVNGTGRYYGWNYDPLYRLTNETMHGATAGNVSYGYDPVGNRTNRTSSLAALGNQAPIYNANDWMTNSDGYDNDGNPTNSMGKTYVYDAMDHLTNANSGQILITYDGDGNRVSKKVNGTNFYYLVDNQNPSGYSQVLEEWSSTGTPALGKVYNYGSDLISQKQPNISTNYFITDGHGSTRMLMDNGGNIMNVFVYDAFGNLIASNGALQTAYLYSGQQYDSDLCFYYNRARYLNTGTGRFWTMDTDYGNNENPESLHKYLYAQNNPVNDYDPSGHDVGYFAIRVGTILGAFLQRTVGVPTPYDYLGGGITLANGLGLGAFNPTSTLPIRQVGDGEIDYQLHKCYLKILHHEETYGPVPTEDWSDWQQLMVGTLDTRYKYEPQYRYEYIGSEHPLMLNRIFINNDLNYLGVGTGFAARGDDTAQMIFWTNGWLTKEYGAIASSNLWAAEKTGYDWFNQTFHNN